MAAFDLTVRFRKKEHAVQLTVGNPSTKEVASAIAAVTGAAAETIKLLLPGRKGQMLKLIANSNQSAQHAGEDPVKLWQVLGVALAKLSITTLVALSVNHMISKAFKEPLVILLKSLLKRTGRGYVSSNNLPMVCCPRF